MQELENNPPIDRALEQALFPQQLFDDSIDAIFRPGGLLESHLQLQHRPQQSLMASAVASAICADRTLLFEAGTGVGKTLAYLIPSLLHAYLSGRPCVVSTHTLSLQEQITVKDLPLCRALFEQLEKLLQDEHLHNLSEFKATLLMGRSNYLCPMRLAQALANRAELMPAEHFHELEQILMWSTQTQTGLIEELPRPPSPEIWEWISAESSACNRKTCSPRTCFYTAARVAAQTAQLVIVNHSLLFSLIQSGAAPSKARGVLLPDDFVIIDEAHTAAEIACDHFGIHLHSFGLEKDLKCLYHPTKKKGLLMQWRDVNGLIAVNEAIVAVGQFFDLIRGRQLAAQDVVRLTETPWSDSHVLPALLKVIEHLQGLITQNEELDDVSELRDQRSRLEKSYQALVDCLELKKPDQVYWVERTGRLGHHVALRSAPMSVAPYLRAHVFEKQTAAILTSATLSSEGRSMTHFQRKVGAQSAQAEIVDSPFDYQHQMRIYIASDAPIPGADSPRLSVPYMADMILFCAQKVAGGTLVLCTSYTDMRALHEATNGVFEFARRPVFVQGEGGSRSELTERFKRAGNGILFGTDSFWTGVDVPGSALSQVILTRLPFDNPSHPLTQARFEAAKAAGRNPFADITLPDALIQFRQGIGRLIRHKDDCGVLTCLDGRLLSKSYGSQFIATLPHGKYVTLSKTNRDRVFEPL